MKNFFRNNEVQIAFIVWTAIFFLVGVCVGLIPYISTL